MRAPTRPILATILVAVLPVATVWALWALGVVTSLWIGAPLVLALALLASLAGAAYWQRRPATGDVLFSDLLLWGWLRRARAEHQLADAVELLSRVGADDEAEKLRLLKQLAAALDAKDPYLDGHSRRVARFSSLMAGRLGMAHDESVRLQTAAAVHDVGKLHVPAEILTKPDKLTPPEEDAVHQHADEGAAMVACLGDPALSDIVRHHHERFDGSGYPVGLAGEAIPLGARIVAVADTFDAITSARPYRPAGTHKYALDVLVAGAGTQLDPVVVRAFVREYTGRRGLALWALLMLPIAKARRHPLPAGIVMAGIVLAGAAATAGRFAGTADDGNGARGTHDARVHIGPPATSTRSASARRTHRKTAPARPGRPQRAALTHAATGRATPHTILVAAVTRRPTATRRTAVHPHPTATQDAPGARSRRAPPRTTPRRPAPSPGPTRTPRPKAPPPASTPHPITPPRASTPRPPTSPPVATPRPPASTPPSTPGPTSPPPTSTPVSAPQPAPNPPPAPTTGQQCKKGGYGAYGYRNQGQCVSLLNRP